MPHRGRFNAAAGGGSFTPCGRVSGSVAMPVAPDLRPPRLGSGRHLREDCILDRRAVPTSISSYHAGCGRPAGHLRKRLSQFRILLAKLCQRKSRYLGVRAVAFRRRTDAERPAGGRAPAKCLRLCRCKTPIAGPQQSDPGPMVPSTEHWLAKAQSPRNRKERRVDEALSQVRNRVHNPAATSRPRRRCRRNWLRLAAYGNGHAPPLSEPPRRFSSRSAPFPRCRSPAGPRALCGHPASARAAAA